MDMYREWQGFTNSVEKGMLGDDDEQVGLPKLDTSAAKFCLTPKLPVEFGCLVLSYIEGPEEREVASSIESSSDPDCIFSRGGPQCEFLTYI